MLRGFSLLVNVLQIQKKMDIVLAVDDEDIEEGLEEGFVSQSWEMVKMNPNDPGSCIPSQRSLHISAIHRHHMYIFGGYEGGARVNKFHRFDFLNLLWQEVIAVEGSPPSPRDRHTGAVVADRLLVFGGYDGVHRTNDLYLYNFEGSSWEQVEKSNPDQWPSARHSHSAVSYGDSMYIFGGYDGAYKNDLYRFNLESRRWSKVAAKGRHPQARYRASCVVFEDSMYLFGGHDGSKHLSDTHMFDFIQNSWSKVDASGHAPLPRDSHVSVVYQSRMFVFGGSSGSAMNDFHYLSLKDRSWCAVPSDGWFPSARFCHTAVEYDNSMYIYGGYDGHARLKDFHRFKFAPSTCIVERSSLLEDLAHKVGDSMMSDIQFRIEGTIVHGHKLFCGRSPVLLAHEGVMDIENTTHDLFLVLLSYLYTDKISIHSPENALELYALAQRFQVDRLKRICLAYLANAFTIENAAQVFMAAEKFQISDLRERALQFILQNFNEVSRSVSFEEMGRTNVELVFQILRARGDSNGIVEDSTVPFDLNPETSVDMSVLTESGSLFEGRGWHLVVYEEFPIEATADNEQLLSPTNRSLHAMGAHGNSLYVFGGFNGERRVNDLFRFDILSRRWWKVSPRPRFMATDSTAFVYGEPPSPRDRHSAVVSNDSLWVFGGFDGRSRVNEFNAFDFTQSSWLRMVPTALTPSARHSHSSVAFENKLYIFGGYDGTYKNDLHCFDTPSMEWENMNCTGTLPTPRYRTSLVAHEKSLFVFGGHDGLSHLRDLFAFNTETMVWSAISYTGIRPTPRDSHVATVYGNHMYVFGGSSGNAMNDLFRFRLSNLDQTPAWTKIQFPLAPCARFCHAAAVSGKSMYIYGGYDGQNRLNDMFKFSFLEPKITMIPRSTLVTELNSFVGNPLLSDICFLVEGIQIPAHRVVCMRCPYFEAMFSVGMRESSEPRIEIKDVRHDVFCALLQYLYTDRQDVSLDMAMELFVCADRFGVERLKNMCENKMLSSIDIENVSDYFCASQSHNAISLNERCLDFIVRNFDRVSKTQRFERIMRANNDLLFVVLHTR